MTSRVKVSTEKLIEAVRARREQAVADHGRAIKEYEAHRVDVQHRVVKALSEALSRARLGEFPSSGYNSLSVPFEGGRLPTEPDPVSSEVQRIDRLLKTLEMAAEPTITISADDAARYLG